MSVSRAGKAQELCEELFLEIEAPMSDAWISDDAGTDDPDQYLRLVYGSLLALEEARGKIKKFLRRHKFKPR